jgi:hypothetical protein
MQNLAASRAAPCFLERLSRTGKTPVLETPKGAFPPIVEARTIGDRAMNPLWSRVITPSRPVLYLWKSRFQMGPPLRPDPLYSPGNASCDTLVAELRVDGNGPVRTVLPRLPVASEPRFGTRLADYVAKALAVLNSDDLGIGKATCTGTARTEGSRPARRGVKEHDHGQRRNGPTIGDLSM